MKKKNRFKKTEKKQFLKNKKKLKKIDKVYQS